MGSLMPSTGCISSEEHYSTGGGKMRGSKEEKNIISRRKVLLGTGALVAGAAVTQLGGFIKPAKATGGKTEKWPWPYVKLDPTKTAEICYNEWYRVFCGAAVINSVFSQLREKVGEPYVSFPADSFVFLEGGQVGGVLSVVLRQGPTL